MTSWPPFRTCAAKLKSTYQSHFFIRSSSPSAHARATALMAASTERTVPAVNSLTLPDTLTAMLLANPGACVTSEIVIRPLGGLGYPFRLDLFLAFLGRAPAF